MHFNVLYYLSKSDSYCIFALLAQLDRVTGYEPVGRGFESPAACQNSEVDICLLRYFYMLRRVRETSIHRGPRKAFGFVGKGETYGVFVTNWLDNLFEYAICLDETPI